MKPIALEVVVILATFTVVWSSDLTCYECTWNSYIDPDEEYYCRDLENFPSNITVGDCALCKVYREYHNGEVKYVDRDCESESTDDLGNVKSGCYSVDYDRGERRVCYCAEELCNGGRQQSVVSTVTIITTAMVAIVSGLQRYG